MSKLTDIRQQVDKTIYSMRILRSTVETLLETMDITLTKI